VIEQALMVPSPAALTHSARSSAKADPASSTTDASATQGAEMVRDEKISEGDGLYMAGWFLSWDFICHRFFASGSM